MGYKEFLHEAANVRPTPRQAKWFDTEFYGFVHFSVNTFTNRDLGLGTEPESVFDPVDLDCDQWVETIKSAGGKALILTAKHHDGFCIWPSKYTEHCVKNSAWRGGKGDVVKEAAEACRRGGIGFGLYISLWDRNSPYYGTPEYNDYYCNQLTELLTGYGELFALWFDSACYAGPNGKKQVYDFPRYISLIRKYQPNAVIFNDFGPDVRWVGNEGGLGRVEEWAVVPKELCFRSEVQTGPGPEEGTLEGINNRDHVIGDLTQIRYSKGLVFAPSEFDMSIRPSWFYHPNEEPHSLERLMRTYITSVGGNGCFNLNIPPMPSGRFDEKDVQRMKEFGEALRAAFGTPIEAEMERKELSETQCEITLRLPEKKHISYVVIEEDLVNAGQRVECFMVSDDDNPRLFKGTTIGHKRICPVDSDTTTITVKILSAREKPVFRAFTLY